MDGHRERHWEGYSSNSFPGATQQLDLQILWAQALHNSLTVLFITTGTTIFVSAVFTALSTLGMSWSQSPRALWLLPYRAMANRMALSLSPWPQGSAGRARTPCTAPTEHLGQNFKGKRWDHHSLKGLPSLPTQRMPEQLPPSLKPALPIDRDKALGLRSSRKPWISLHSNFTKKPWNSGLLHTWYHIANKLLPSSCLFLFSTG